jgi:hypothetical protein
MTRPSLLVRVAPKTCSARKIPSLWWRRARWRTSARCAFDSSKNSWIFK